MAELQMKMDRINEVKISITQKLQSPKISPSNPSIFEVPEFIRKPKKECYIPSTISIGPIHSGNPSVAAMQEMKLAHLTHLLGITGNNDQLHEYIEMIAEKEDQIRGCYAVKIPISSSELIELVLVDAAFIVYLIMSVVFHEVESSPIEAPMQLHSGKIIQDLFLLENQLPFFVLECLYNKAFRMSIPDRSFINLACDFLAMSYIPGAKFINLGTTKDIQLKQCKHLVDLLRICWLPSQLREQHLYHNGNDPDYPVTATNLKAAGVKFRARDSINLLDISFKDGVLEIPRLTLHDSAESIFRNLLCYEQFLFLEDSYVLDYLIFLDDLIDTPEDVQILIKSGIIQNQLGDNATPSQLFNNITNNSVLDSVNFYYSEVCRELNEFTKKRHHRWIAVLRRDYFNHPWAIISVIYAILLLILTVLQVVTGFRK